MDWKSYSSPGFSCFVQSENRLSESFCRMLHNFAYPGWQIPSTLIARTSPWVLLLSLSPHELFLNSICMEKGYKKPCDLLCRSSSQLKYLSPVIESGHSDDHNCAAFLSKSQSSCELQVPSLPHRHSPASSFETNSSTRSFFIMVAERREHELRAALGSLKAKGSDIVNQEVNWCPENGHDEYGNSIPIIDLAAMQAGTPEKRNGVIKQIAKACQEWGFFQVVNHSFPLDLLAKGFENSMVFFNSPLEEKLKCKHPKGSVPVPAAFINDMSTKGVPDRKEMMFIHSDSSPMARFNLWPENPANFRAVAAEVAKEHEKAGLYMLGLISESLGLPNNYLSNLSMPRSNMFYFLCYPPTQDEGEAVGSAMHTDGDILTVLAIHKEQPGLQILKGDRWIPLNPVQGALVINVGDALQVWTNDVYKSVTHRVMNSQRTQRFSMPLLIGPSPDAVIEPIPLFIDEDHPAVFKPFVWKDYLMARFKNKYNPSKAVPEIGLDNFCRL